MKGLLKKIALLTLVFSLIVPFIPKAYAAVNLADYTSKTLEEALKEEEIEYNFTHTAKANQVTIYLFRGRGCGYCHKFLEYAANTLMKDYNDKINIVTYEVWYDEKNGELFQGIAEMLGGSADGVPFIVIGSKYWGGYSETMNEEITSTIESEYANSNKYDALTEYINYVDTKEKEAKKANTPDLSGAIIWNFIFTAAATVIVLAFVNKKFNELSGKSPKNDSDDYDDESIEEKSKTTTKKKVKK